jgi:hypothetical protein
MNRTNKGHGPPPRYPTIVQILVAAVILLFLLHFGSVSRVSDGVSTNNAPAGPSPALLAAQENWVAPSHVSRSSYATFAEQDNWINTQFVASDPAYQGWCVKSLLSGTDKDDPLKQGGQFGQDIFAARNLFLDYAMQGTKLFYVEAGANDYKHLSNSFFFDKCLGWAGLCVEPLVGYHPNLKAHRSCTLVPKCLSSGPMKMMIQPSKTSGAEMKPITDPVPEGWAAVGCDSLTNILAELGRTHVDFFILDVEGAEFVVLDSIEFNKVSISSWLIESNKLFGSKLDYIMNMKGYFKFHQLSIDSLYVNRAEGTLGRRLDVWYPPQWMTKFSRMCAILGTCREDCDGVN